MHCYRMLGSFADAEDAVQETMLAAWQGIGGFTEERASLRTWLYKIATNRCLNARRAASRRPAREWDMSQFEPPVPTPRDEPVWLQPFPDALLEGAVDRASARHSRRDRLPMLREMRSERSMTSKGLFREPADHGNRWRNPVTVGAS